MAGLRKPECVALIEFHIGLIGRYIKSADYLDVKGDELQEFFDRIDTFVQAIKVMDRIGPSGSGS